MLNRILLMSLLSLTCFAVGPTAIQRTYAEEVSTNIKKPFVPEVLMGDRVFIVYISSVHQIAACSLATTKYPDNCSVTTVKPETTPDNKPISYTLTADHNHSVVVLVSAYGHIVICSLAGPISCDHKGQVPNT
jgi:hypothetical protein